MYSFCLSLSEDEKVGPSGGAVDGKLGEKDLTNSGNGSSSGPGSVATLRVLDGEGRAQGQQGPSSQVNAPVKEDYDSSATVS